MPHASLKILPLDTNATPTLGEAAITDCNLIRYVPDGKFVLVQKLGGWRRFWPTPFETIPRALWPWQDLNNNQHLAVGCAPTATLSGVLQSIDFTTRTGASSQNNVTPHEVIDNVPVNFATVTGSNVVNVVDALTNVTDYDSVFIATPVSIGGLVLFGFYQCHNLLSSTAFDIWAYDILGNPAYATSTVPHVGGAVPLFTTTIASNTITVTLANHGYVIGSEFVVLIPVVFNGVTIIGHYPVISVVDVNSFTILSNTLATASGAVSMNNGKVNLTFYMGAGAVPGGSGYGFGGYGTGGYGTGTGIVPVQGYPIYAEDWSLDNWGEILISCPVVPFFVNLKITGATGTGAAVTVTFTPAYTAPVGNVIQIYSMNPSTYNGTYYITASSPGSVTFASTVNATFVSGGSANTTRLASSPIFAWDPSGGEPFSTVIWQGPASNDGCFVAMPQRQIVAWGSSFTGYPDPLLLRWCDVEDYTEWVAKTTNQAGSYRLPKGSKIVSALQGPQQGLVWTDLGIWSMQYIGQPFVYSFNELASGCGLIGRRAAGTLNGVVYWMSQTQFYMLGGGGVQVMPCPIWDVIFQDMDIFSSDKIRFAANSQFNEIAWYFPEDEVHEVSRYVKYNTVIQQWDFGTLGRSAWTNQSIFGPPIGADPVTRLLYQHETALDDDGKAMPSYFQTGFFVINEADMKTFIDQVWPDAKWGGYDKTPAATVNLTFFVSDYAGQTPVQYGPYPMTKTTTFISPRFRGRLVSIYLGSTDVGSWWRIGNLRYRYMPDGKF
jgi:hypothetical protein